MKSLKTIPSALIESVCRNLCDGLWQYAQLAEQNNCRELAASINDFQEELRDHIIRELVTHSIYEE